MRLFTDGAEFRDLLFWDFIYNTGHWSISTGTKRSGAASYYVPHNSNAYKNVSVSDGEIYFKWCVNRELIGATPGFYARNGTTVLGGVSVSGVTGKVDVMVGAGIVASSIIPINMSRWYCIEWHLKINNTAGISELRIDGIPDISYSGDTEPGSTTYIDNIKYLGVDYNGAWLDDIACNDVSNADGLNDTGWCGTGGVVLLTPNGEGYSTEWSCSTGSTHYSLVDEIPPNADTDYVYSSTANQIDAYTLSDFDATNKTIQRVWTEARAYDYGASASQISLGFRTTEGTNYFSTTNSTLTGSYTRVAGDTFKINPATSTTWQDADLDALQVLVKEIS